MADNRRAPRKKSFLAAYASPHGGQGPLPCLVRDLSRTGARIMLAGAERMPETFDVHINGRNQVLRVQTQWRSATEVGVRLLAKIPLQSLEAGTPAEASRARAI